MPKMLTWLLSLAVAAAASPPLNVTLTNNLVGVTTVRVNGAGLRVAATLGADSSLFHARYREVHIADGRTTITRQSPRPHHAGTASGEADGEVFTDGRATATIEQGRLKSLVVRLPGKHVEVHDEDGVYARVHSPSNDYVWAEPKTFERTRDNLRRQLASNECAGGENSNSAPVKYVSVVAFNDAERYARRGTDVELRTAVWKSKFRHTAAIFDVVRGIYADAPPYGLWDGSNMRCKIQIVLAGQITWRDGNPRQIDYVQGAACETSSCAEQRCGPDEVSSSCLLDSFTEYVRDNRDALERALGVEIDNAHLLTARNLGGATIGLAWTGGMCDALGRSSAVEQSAFSSKAFVGTIVAHELGHNLGMPHDAGGKYLMAPSASTGEPSGLELQFSDQSRRSAENFLVKDYGRGWTSSCLENVVEDGEWDKATCGDGVVDDGEDCDPGLLEDPCCDSRCRLKEECTCAVADACCSDEGTFLEAGTPCRAAGDPACDREETCTGQSGDCPTDLFSRPGAPCVDFVDGRNVEGVCFRGSCMSEEDNCAGLERNGVPAVVVCPSQSSCAGYACKPLESRDLDWCVPSSLPAADGTPCGDGKQCLARTIEKNGDGLFEADCVDSTQLYLYHWNRGVDGCDEVATCVDQAGTTVATERCDEETGGVGPPPRPPRCGGGDVPGYFDDDSSGSDDDDDKEARELFFLWVVLLVVLAVLVACLCVGRSFCTKRRKPRHQRVVELPPTYQPSPPPYEPRRASYAYGENHAPVAQPVIRAQSAPVVAEPVSPMHDEFEAARQASLAAEAERERRLARRRAEERRREDEELERARVASLNEAQRQATGTSFSRREIQELEAARRASLAADADRQRRYQAREAARRRERDDTAAALALSRVTSGQSTSRSVRRPPAYSGAAPPPPPPPPPNPFRATPSSSRGESSYARRERLSRQMDL